MLRLDEWRSGGLGLLKTWPGQHGQAALFITDRTFPERLKRCFSGISIAIVLVWTGMKSSEWDSSVRGHLEHQVALDGVEKEETYQSITILPLHRQ